MNYARFEDTIVGGDWRCRLFRRASGRWVRCVLAEWDQSTQEQWLPIVRKDARRRYRAKYGIPLLWMWLLGVIINLIWQWWLNRDESQRADELRALQAELET